MSRQIEKYDDNHDIVALRGRFQVFTPRSEYIAKVNGNTAALAIWYADAGSDIQSGSWAKFSENFPANGGMQVLKGSPGYDCHLGGATTRLDDPGANTTASFAEVPVISPGFVQD